MWPNVPHCVLPQCLCPQGEPQLPPTSPGVSPRPAGGPAQASVTLLLLPCVMVRVILYVYR